MTEDPILFPRWRRNRTMSEFVDDVNSFCKAPDRNIQSAVLVYNQELPNGNVTTNYIDFGFNTFELIGVLDLAKSRIDEDTRG